MKLAAHYNNNDWDSFLAIAPTADAMSAGDTLSLADPTLIFLAEAWSQAPAESWHWPDRPITLPLLINRAGLPETEVAIGDQTYRFIIDTGASMSVLSSRVANACGIEPLTTEAIPIGTSLDQDVDTRPIIIPELRLGDLIIRNHPAFHLAQENLEAKLLFISILRIDGIIGWNALARMRCEFDLSAGELTISRPHTTTGGGHI